MGRKRSNRASALGFLDGPKQTAAGSSVAYLKKSLLVKLYFTVN